MMTPAATKAFKERIKERIEDLSKNRYWQDDSKGKDESVNMVVSNDYVTEDLRLPEVILLSNNRMMKLRSYAAVVRRHKFKLDKDPHEFFYSQLQHYRPWFSEGDLSPENIEECKNLYLEKDINPTSIIDEATGKEIILTQIETVKSILYPHMADVQKGREMVEKYEFDKTEEIGAELDPQGEKNDAEGEEEGQEEADEYLGLHSEGIDDNYEGRPVEL